MDQLIEVQRHGDVVVARILDDVEYANAADVFEQIADEIAPNGRGLVVDLTDVRFIDSAGTGIFYRLLDKLRPTNQPLAIAIPEAAQLRRVLKFSGIFDFTVGCASIDECVRVLLAPQDAPE
jgi:anti-anti-sigma factor